MKCRNMFNDEYVIGSGVIGQFSGSMHRSVNDNIKFIMFHDTKYCLYPACLINLHSLFLITVLFKITCEKIDIL